MRSFEAPAELSIVHQFALSSVAGTTVLLRDLLDAIPRVAPHIRAEYISFEDHPTPGNWLLREGRTAVVGVNLQIDYRWDQSLRYMDFYRDVGLPVHLWVHDYWPKNRNTLETLHRDFNVNLLASTDVVRSAMLKDGLEVDIVQVGIPLGNLARVPPSQPKARPFVIGTAGRVVARKRQLDIMRAFGRTGLVTTELRMQLAPSLVRSADSDSTLMALLLTEAKSIEAAGQNVSLRSTPTERHDYGAYDVYVCASDYEGFSLTPIEAMYCGCPAIMSDIPAHRSIARAIYPGPIDEVLYPTADIQALSEILKDEATTHRRGTRVLAELEQVRATVHERWSPERMATSLLEAVFS